ncbi:MAG: hypothetical protein M1816_003360 [Peltula sp. TS41687]|nr:MAG: hypothetical protein M1816_003360 [Peltula sp. TS41687]
MSRQILAAFITRHYSSNAPNPFQAKKPWPPDFTKLSVKHQFQLEKKYKRRAKLKWARPRWIKAVTIAQWSSITFAMVYGVLIMDWGTEDTPFKGIRGWFRKQVDAWKS